MSEWTFPAVVQAAGYAEPELPVLIHGDRSITSAALEVRVSRFAAAVADAGLAPGSAIAQYLPNGPAYIESVLGALHAGCTPMNTNYRYVDDELRYIWEDAGVRAVVFHTNFRETVRRLIGAMPQVAHWIEVDGDPDHTPPGVVPYEQWIERAGGTPPATGDEGTLLLLYTGGTTGRPKGVMWQQGDLLSLLNSMSHRAIPDHGTSREITRRVHELGIGPPILIACPLMHGTGLFHALIALSTGTPVVTVDAPRFDAAQLLDVIEAHRVGSIVIVGDAFARPMLDELDAAPDRWDLSSLRVVFSSGAMLSQSVKARLVSLLPRLRIVDALGSSEASGLGSSVSSAADVGETASFRLGANAGVLLDDGTWATPGDGRRGLLATTGWLPLGYWNDPAKTAEVFREIDGRRWVIPGDHATLEHDGTLRLLGRGSGCINTAGEKVYPEEVEECLKLHPNVTDAAVVGAPDERFGEVVVAFVETDDPLVEVKEFVRQRLAGYKVPRLVIPVRDVDRSANGKLDLRALRERAAQRWQSNG